MTAQSPDRISKVPTEHQPAAAPRGSPETHDDIMDDIIILNTLPAVTHSDITDPDHWLVSSSRLLLPQWNLMENKQNFQLKNMTLSLEHVKNGSHTHTL